MSSLRFTLVALVALATVTSPAFAQRGHRMGGHGRGMYGMHHMRGPQQRPAMLLQGITLTPAQQLQVDSIRASTMGRMQATTPRMRPDSATRAQRWALMDEHHAAMRAVLTPAQQAVWDQNLARMRANMPPRP